ncbi:MAG: HEAT repeat domain-containing protein [Symploca sp. SIO1A3]|nr:HEAT repeat domain-containing protein [Symploca sp. SIO1A3]
MVDCSTQSPDPVETEQLLAQINEQLAQGTFDSTDSQLLQRMTEALADGRGMIRLGLVEAFGEIGKPAAPFLLEALAHHPNPVVRRSAAKGLAKIDEPQAIPTLIEAMLKDEDTVVRGSAAGALSRRGAAAAPALLEIIAGDYSKTAKGQAIWAVASIGAEATEQLYEAFQSEQVEVRTAVVGAIANIASSSEHQDEGFEQIIISALQDEAVEVRMEAATTLSQFPPQFALPNLLPLLDDPNPDLIRTAVLSLGKLGDSSALPYLQEKLADERVGIPQVTKIAISQIESSSIGLAE